MRRSVVVALLAVLATAAVVGAEYSPPPPHDHDHDHDAVHGHSHGSSCKHGHAHGHAHDHHHHHHGLAQEYASYVSAYSPITWLAPLMTTPSSSALWATAFISLVPILFLFLVPSNSSAGRSPIASHVLRTLVAFAVGGLLGDVFLHLLPHAFEGGHDHSHSHDQSVSHDHSAHLGIGLLVLGGMLTFFLTEKLLRSVVGGSGHSHSHGDHGHDDGHGHSHDEGHGHSHDDGHGHSHDHSHATDASGLRHRGGNAAKPASPPTPDAPSTADNEHMLSLRIGSLLNLVADFMHNFTDGMAIAASFMSSPAVGISTTIAVFFHEIPHEIGDFAVLIQSGYSRRAALIAQLFTAVGAFAGCLFGLAVSAAGAEGDGVSWVVPFTAGGFIYVATVSIIPSLLTRASFAQTVAETLAMCAGVGAMALIALYE